MPPAPPSFSIVPLLVRVPNTNNLNPFVFKVTPEFMVKLKKSGVLKNRSFNIVSRFFLSAFFVISFFYATPLFINFADKNLYNKEFTNNSKNILKNTMKCFMV